MASRFYLRSATQAGFRPTAGEHSAVLPAGSSAGSFSAWRQLVPSMGSGAISASRSSLAQTEHQDGAIQGWSSYPLAAGSIAAGTWTIGLQLKESNFQANTFLVLSLYVWRPSTDSVVGYIYDSDTPLGSEWSTDTNGSGQVITFSGAGVDVEDGDVLALEVWFHAEQGNAVLRTNTVYFNGSTVVTPGYTGTDPASYLDPPADIPLYEGLVFRGLGAGTASAGQQEIAASAPGASEIGDLIVALFVGPGSGPPVGDPVGGSGSLENWTELDVSGTYSTNALTHLYRAFYKVLGADDFSNLPNGTVKTARFNAAANPAALHVVAWRGNHDTEPIVDAQSQSNSHASGTDIEAPSADAVASAFENVLQCSFTWSRGGLGGTSGTSPPSGMLEIGDTSSTWPSWETAIEYVLPGSTGTRTATAAESHLQCAGVSLVIQSALRAVGGYWGVLVV